MPPACASSACEATPSTAISGICAFTLPMARAGSAAVLPGVDAATRASRRSGSPAATLVDKTLCVAELLAIIAFSTSRPSMEKEVPPLPVNSCSGDACNSQLQTGIAGGLWVRWPMGMGAAKPARHASKQHRTTREQQQCPPWRATAPARSSCPRRGGRGR